jgi:beta-lactam-binding protein with PASTA domain
MARLDGKFEVSREIETSGNRTSYEAVAPDGAAVRVDWFSVTDTRSRSDFHRYRSALKAAGSPLLLDAVARPGAYYSAWLPSTAQEGGAFLAAHSRDDAYRSTLDDLAACLSDYGFSLADARVLALESREGGRPTVRAVLQGLDIADRSAEEISRLNAQWMGPAGRRVSRRKAPPAKPARPASGATTTVPAAKTTALKPAPPAPVRRRLTIWGVLPGLIFLALAAYNGVGALAAFLEPPVVRVPKVTGLQLREAVRVLSEARLTPRAENGEDASLPSGAIISQDPPADSSLHESRVVTVTVNHPRPLTVPDVAGLSLDAARDVLAAKRLTIGKVLKTPPLGTRTAAGLVVGQAPPAETPVLRGQAITLAISAPDEPVQSTFVPDLTGLDWRQARELVEMAGLSLASIRWVESRRPEGTVVNQQPEPYKLVEAAGEATISIARAPLAAAPPRRSEPVTPPTPQAAEPTPPTVTTPPAQEPPVTTEAPAPASQEETAPQGPGSRVATYRTTVPITLNEVTVEVRLADADGERTVVGPTRMRGGDSILAEAQARGPAVFSIFFDGQEQVEFRLTVPDQGTNSTTPR